jgi:hypothetical protein
VDASIVQNSEENTLEHWIDAQNGKKRNYIYDYGKSRSCTHPTLRELVQGSNWYRCEECNYALFIMTAFQQPLHNVVLQGVMNALHFSKEFGVGALQEVLRRPIGQYDGSEQKPALPEGMSLSDTLMALEEIDVTASDGGERQLRSLISARWGKHGFLQDGRSRCIGEYQRHYFNGEGRCRRCNEVRYINGHNPESLTDNRGTG